MQKELLVLASASCLTVKLVVACGTKCKHLLNIQDRQDAYYGKQYDL